MGQDVSCIYLDNDIKITDQNKSQSIDGFFSSFNLFFKYVKVRK